jgi:hypothetical protein
LSRGSMRRLDLYLLINDNVWFISAMCSYPFTILSRTFLLTRLLPWPYLPLFVQFYPSLLSLAKTSKKLILIPVPIDLGAHIHRHCL